MTDRELIQQALGYMESVGQMDMHSEEWAIAVALKERLAQPVQEPVVWMYQDKSTHEVQFQKHMRSFVDHSKTSEVPLYSEPLANYELQCVCGAVWLGEEMVHTPDASPQPRQWQGLTVAQIEEAFQQSAGADEDTHIRFARAIEAKLKEKNT